VIHPGDPPHAADRRVIEVVEVEVAARLAASCR